MKWIGKVAGGLLGLLTLGPVGAALGVLLGHQLDEQEERAEPRGSPEDVAAIGERFFRATYRVMGYVAKADGRVSEQEILAARAVMAELRLSAAQVREAIELFTEGKQPGFDPLSELQGLRHACRGRPQILRVFLEIQVRAALAGNNMEGPVRPLMSRLAVALRISGLELAQIEAVLRIQRGGVPRAATRRPLPRRRRGRAAAGLPGARDRAARERRGGRQGVPAPAASPPSRQAESERAARIDDGARQAAHSADHRGLRVDSRPARDAVAHSSMIA